MQKIESLISILGVCVVNGIGDVLVGQVFQGGQLRLVLPSTGCSNPLFFANNNVNYARWLPIHLRDMASLKQTQPEVFNEFQLEKFLVHKTH